MKIDAATDLPRIYKLYKSEREKSLLVGGLRDQLLPSSDDLEASPSSTSQKLQARIKWLSDGE